MWWSSVRPLRTDHQRWGTPKMGFLDMDIENLEKWWVVRKSYCRVTWTLYRFNSTTIIISVEPTYLALWLDMRHPQQNLEWSLQKTFWRKWQQLRNFYLVIRNCNWFSLNLSDAEFPNSALLMLKLSLQCHEYIKHTRRKNSFSKRRQKPYLFAPFGVDNSVQPDSRQISQTGRKTLGDCAEFSNTCTLNFLTQKILSSGRSYSTMKKKSLLHDWQFVCPLMLTPNGAKR